MCAPRLELRWEARLVEVDAVAAHWDAFCEQQLSLWLSLGNCSVGAYDAVPGKMVIGREDAPDEAWDTRDHELGTRGAVGQVWLRRAVRLGWGSSTRHRQGVQGVRASGSARRS